MHFVLGLLSTSLCGVFGTPEVHKTAAAWFRQTERYYCSILEWSVLQKFIVKAPNGLRVTFKCHHRNSEPQGQFYPPGGGGVLPIMDYTGRLLPKGVPFFKPSVYNRVGMLRVGV